ncbi:hypothetical protein CANMA_003609 [Candida margitis]|uniref:uncharacterized protein n=1 Tax=Candida margitis TaxID=1775924 RepID=UPI0022278B6A|nr:uncharacterized protein CANMA_003609 [Candida margitis]KAI5962834.1 hypothetical protein CANMA_003609 [Candida margitis]
MSTTEAVTSRMGHTEEPLNTQVRNTKEEPTFIPMSYQDFMSLSFLDRFNFLVVFLAGPIINSNIKLPATIDIKKWAFQRVFTVLSLIDLATTYKSSLSFAPIKSNIGSFSLQKYYISDLPNSLVLHRLLVLEKEKSYMDWLVSWEKQRRKDQKRKIEQRKRDERWKKRERQLAKQRKRETQQLAEQRLIQRRLAEQSLVKKQRAKQRWLVEVQSEHVSTEPRHEEGQETTSQCLAWVSSTLGVASHMQPQGNTHNHHQRHAECFNQSTTQPDSNSPLTRQWVFCRTRHQPNSSEPPQTQRTSNPSPRSHAFNPWGSNNSLPPYSVFDQPTSPFNTLSPTLTPNMFVYNILNEQYADQSWEDLPRYAATPSENEATFDSLTEAPPPAYHTLFPKRSLHIS